MPWPEAAPGGADIARIRAPNPGPMSLSGTNTYVVGREPAWVIDPGPDDAGHLEAVRVEGEVRGGIAGVLLTHSHADHTAGVATLGAPVLWGAVSEGDEMRPAAGLAAGGAGAPRAAAGAAAVDSQTELSGTLIAGADQRGSRTSVPDTPFTAIPTPGHAADHACFLWGDVLFCGDLILGEGSTIVPPEAFGGSLADYLRSLERVRGVGANLFAPGHGAWITDPRAKVDEYLSHRQERERKLLAALDGGERSRARLLDAAWSDVPAQLRPAAALAMQAHLEKLEAEGRGTLELID